MVAFIEQFFGMGDIIFTQSIAHHFLEKGYSVLWPVEDFYFEQCRKAYPKITFIPQSIVQPEWFQIKDKRIVGEFQVVPIRWSDSYMKVLYKDVMIAKYMMYEMDWKEWRKHGMWQRDFDNEYKLMSYLDIEGVKYNLINKTFGTGGNRSVNIEISNGCKNVEMSNIPGFTMFDWGLVFENAQEIHTVSTSILYMLELLSIEKPIHLYVRQGVETDFSFVDFLFTKPYILHL